MMVRFIYLPCQRLSLRSSLQQLLFERDSLPLEKNLTLAQIPVYRLKHPTAAIYRSTIALKLDGKQSLEELATKLLASSPGEKSNALLFLEFSLEAREPGWLDFHLCDRSLATWLQQLPQKVQEISGNKLANQEQWQDERANIFPWQYAHARCCSLLRLGHREGLIQLLAPSYCQPGWGWQTPNPIPWCDARGKFQLQHPAERQVLLQLLAVVDALEDCQEVNWWQLTANLSQAILAVEGRCRIFSEIKQKNRELAQSRLGMFAISQLLLQILLEEKIGAIAPREL